MSPTSTERSSALCLKSELLRGGGGAGFAWFIRSEVTYFSRGKEGVCEERKERLQREGVTRSLVVRARGERCQGAAKVPPRPPVRALAKGGCTSLTSLAGGRGGGGEAGRDSANRKRPRG